MCHGVMSVNCTIMPCNQETGGELIRNGTNCNSAGEKYGLK